MGIELPVELTEVAAKAGVTWPKADEDAMRSSAAAWREAGDKIKGLGTSSDGAATRALGGVTGASGDAARGRWAKVVAPDGDFQRAARGCHAAADRLDHAAQQVGAAKVEIVRELTTLAKNNDAAHASANAGNPNALLGLDTLTKGAAANVANLQNTLSAAIRLDSGVDMSHASPPVNTAPGAHGPGGGGGLLSPVTNIVGGVVVPVAGAVAPIVEPVAAVVAPVTETVAPVVGARRVLARHGSRRHQGRDGVDRAPAATRAPEGSRDRVSPPRRQRPRPGPPAGRRRACRFQDRERVLAARTPAHA